MDNYFGDEKQQPTMSIKQVRQASKLCDVCPVFTDCLRWSLEEREEFGVWAGTSGRVRRRIFSLLDEGVTTVDDVIEVFLNGKGDQFRAVGTGEDQARRKARAGEEARRALGGDERGDQGGSGVPAADVG